MRKAVWGLGIVLFGVSVSGCGPEILIGAAAYQALKALHRQQQTGQGTTADPAANAAPPVQENTNKEEDDPRKDRKGCIRLEDGWHCRQL